MAGAGTQLARKTTIEAVYDDTGPSPPGAFSGGRERWWRSKLRVVKDLETDDRKPAGEYFYRILLNTAVFLAAVLVTIMIIGAIGMLHETNRTVKNETISDIPMFLPESEKPKPIKLEEPPMMEEPEQIYTVKNLAPKAVKSAPKIKIDVPRIDVDTQAPSGLDIVINTWNISPLKSEYGMGEVDQVPMATFQIPPDYPYHAKRQGTEGVVSIRFLVTREGEVSSFNVIKATPEGVFDEAARRSVLRWKFKPGVKDGKAVDTWVEMDIEFELG